jgi:hypothetical protein
MSSREVKSQKAKGKRQKEVLHSSFLLAVLGLLLLFSGCNLDNGILTRASSQYFPLTAGAQWTFTHPDGTTSEDSVVGDSEAYNNPCTVVEHDFQEQYLINSNGELRRFVDYELNIGGTDYPLEQSYRLYYVLPFISGNTWSEVFQNSVPVLGDTFVIQHSIAGRVRGDSTVTVQVPAGTFTECYEVDLNETIVAGSAVNLDTTRVNTYEWFAPGVGAVKRLQDTIVTLADTTHLEYSLLGYSVP